MNSYHAAWTIQAAGATHPGVDNRRNEDTYLLGKREALYLLADGMGGLHDGQDASRLAVNAFRRTLLVDSSRSLGEHEWRERLLLAFQTAHQALKTMALQRYGPGSMGSTLAVWWLPARDEPAWVGNVGDSRVYRLRAGQLDLLSEDHTLYHQMEMSRSLDLSVGPDPDARRLLSQAVGSSQFIAPHMLSCKVQADDRFLLCSDGLSEMLTETELSTALGEGNPRTASNRLVDLARKHGGRDNISAIVILLAKQ